MTHNHAICNQWEFFSWMMLTPYTDLSPKCFNTLVEERAKDFATLCVGEGDLGSHSAHIKRSSNLASLCGITIPPPIVSISLLAGWSLGKVKERYLLYGKGGDQYLGHVVSGLDVSLSFWYFSFLPLILWETKSFCTVAWMNFE